MFSSRKRFAMPFAHEWEIARHDPAPYVRRLICVWFFRASTLSHICPHPFSDCRECLYERIFTAAFATPIPYFAPAAWTCSPSSVPPSSVLTISMNKLSVVTAKSAQRNQDAAREPSPEQHALELMGMSDTPPGRPSHTSNANSIRPTTTRHAADKYTQVASELPILLYDAAVIQTGVSLQVQHALQDIHSWSIQYPGNLAKLAKMLKASDELTPINMTSQTQIG